ncbi:hypothetical protein C1646_775539 [Rhizophagus diaphanus]|nr:hypothetical protein C1646_775539 [Rhizophagus diaphanus] [Rhizophagus sp. MUCL 43196]
MSIPEVSEDNRPFRLVVPSSLSNIHRELTPIICTTEPYRSNVSIAKPYRRELTLIIREPYSSNWTRDVNEENAYLWERIDELNRQLDNANSELYDLRLDVGQLQSKGKNLVRNSEDEMEVDEEEARAEMKMILKTFLIELELKYDEKFTSESNDEILDSDNRYHSPEYSESDEEQPDGKRQINVYNPSWRSEELIDLLRNVLDQHAFSLQSAQLIQTQNYADEIYNIVSRHLRGASNWTYIEQNMPADTDFSEPETPIQTEENLIMVEDIEVSAEMDEIAVIEDSEPTGMEESPETEDETDKWYKFEIFIILVPFLYYFRRKFLSF